MIASLALSFGAATGTCAGMLFLVAAFAKLRHRAELPAVIANYRLLPRAAVAPVALALPWIEAGLGLALVTGLAARTGAAGAILLLLAFAWAMATNIRRGRAQIDCGCGIGGLRQPLRRGFVIRNLLLAAALLPLLAVPGLLETAERVAAIAAGGAAFLLLLLLNALLALPARRQLAA